MFFGAHYTCIFQYMMYIFMFFGAHYTCIFQYMMYIFMFSFLAQNHLTLEHVEHAYLTFTFIDITQVKCIS